MKMTQARGRRRRENLRSGIACVAALAACLSPGASGARDAPTAVIPGEARVLEEPRIHDTNLWSLARRRAYARALAVPLPAPLAILELPRLGLRAAVFPGTSDLVLDRGLGAIEGTSLPGDDGNVGLAGHRDGFFRVLKDVTRGDTIRLITPAGSREYAVAEMSVVEPNEVSVLAPAGRPALTLVSCFPFYYVGHAPQRFVVRAYAEERAAGPAS